MFKIKYLFHKLFSNQKVLIFFKNINRKKNPFYDVFNFRFTFNEFLQIPTFFFCECFPSPVLFIPLNELGSLSTSAFSYMLGHQITSD